jgi:hypothetical protein
MSRLTGAGSVMLPTESEENVAATQIQRIARGRQAKHFVQRRRVAFNGAASKIQARIRGVLTRQRVTMVWKRHYAAISIQKVARGRQDRNHVRDLRRFNLHTQ